VRQLVYRVADRFGQIDALINDAVSCRISIGHPALAAGAHLSYDFWNAVIQTNLGGTFSAVNTSAFMEERRTGNIVNLWGGGRPENHGASLTSSVKTPSAPYQIHRRRRA